MGRGRRATSQGAAAERRPKSRVAYAIGSLYLCRSTTICPPAKLHRPAMSRLTRIAVRAVQLRRRWLLRRARAPSAAGFDRRRRAADRPVGAARRADPCRRARPRRAGNAGSHARTSPTITARPKAARWPRNDFVAAKVSDRRRLPLHRIDRGGDADPQGGRHPGDHGRRAHQQPDRPQVQDRLAGLPAGAARRRRAQGGGLDR